MGESFLQIPGVSGDAQDPQHAGWIPLLSATIKITSDKTSGGGGSGGLSAPVSEAAVTRIFSNASPELEIAQNWPAIQIDNAPTKGARIVTLKDATVVSRQDRLIDDGADKFWGEDITFSFARLEESAGEAAPVKKPGPARAADRATQSFLRVPGISGDVNNAPHVGWIQLRGMDDLRADPAKTAENSEGSSRSPEVVPVSDGKSGELTVVKDADGASSKLFAALQDRTRFSQIVIDIVGNRSQTITLEDVVISMVGTTRQAPESREPRDERITFAYERRELGGSRSSRSKDEATKSAIDSQEQVLPNANNLRGDMGPVGAGEHVVQQGECISSIAKETGHFWQTIWDEPANAELRNVRKDPNVLLPGDRVCVPSLQPKSEAGQTEMRHRFRVKNQPEMLRIRVLRDGKPRKNQPYTLDVDGKVRRGTTDADGKVECPIAPNARRAALQVGSGLDQEEHVFQLGAIDPIDSVSGVQGRLNNLGFDCGPVTGRWGEDTERAVRKFQASCGLPETGEVDDTTRGRLQEKHGC